MTINPAAPSISAASFRSHIDSAPISLPEIHLLGRVAAPSMTTPSALANASFYRQVVGKLIPIARIIDDLSFSGAVPHDERRAPSAVEGDRVPCCPPDHFLGHVVMRDSYRVIRPFSIRDKQNQRLSLPVDSHGRARRRL